MEKIRSAEKQAHLYALLAWNKEYDKESAEKLIDEKELSELSGITWADGSIAAAKKGIEEKDIKGKLEKNPEEVYDAIIEILADIHDQWVKDNPHKFDRKDEQKSEENIFQHLPTAMIGVDELSKDLMFLAPFLQEMGIDVGEMQMRAEGNFIPNKAVVDAYQKYVEAYREKHGIFTENDLRDDITKSINGAYEPLKPKNVAEQKKESAMPRLRYMAKRTKLLTEAVVAKNPEGFQPQAQPQ